MTLPRPAQPNAAYFDAPVCHNCGAALATAYCGACGQKRARRLDFGAVRIEAWQSYRLFEMSLVKGALRMARAPGLVAREFVLGARAVALARAEGLIVRGIRDLIAIAPPLIVAREEIDFIFTAVGQVLDRLWE
mgnify:CR=1 FL=1